MNNSFRVVQIIDSLNAGGSERMAVQIANGLSKEIEFSGLISTRAKGILETQIDRNVNYFFLKKKCVLDIEAIYRLFRYITRNRINIIHAHSTSYFLATLVKILKQDVKIIWHDHYGNSSFLKNRPSFFLKLCSNFFTTIISVNNVLKDWAEEKLNCKKVIFLENFIENKIIVKKEEKSIFTILHLANLRPQKDHLTSLKAIKLLNEKGFKIKVDYVGDTNLDKEYYKSLLQYVEKNDLSSIVKFHGSCSDINRFLEIANLGILTSISEGLPLSLLEYALAKLPVVVTDVGQCTEVVGKSGTTVDVSDPEGLACAIMKYYNDKKLSSIHGTNFQIETQRRFNQKSILRELIDIYYNK